MYLEGLVTDAMCEPLVKADDAVFATIKKNLVEIKKLLKEAL